MVIRDQDQPIEEILVEMKKHYDTVLALQEILITRAKLQGYTERQFNDLVQVARDSIEFMNNVRVGDVIQPEWIEERNMLVERAQRLIADT